MSVALFHWDVSPTEKRTASPSLASRLIWSTFALDALPGTLTDEAAGHDAAVDNSSSKDGDARDHSYGFVVAEKLVKSAEEKSKRQIEEEEEEALLDVEPTVKIGTTSSMSPMDKFDWDALSP